MNQDAHEQSKVMRGFTSPEQVPAPPIPEQRYDTATERIAEKEPVQVEQEEKFLDETISTLKNALRKKPKHVPKMPQVRDEMTVRVEHIMEHGLADAYKSMSPIQQQQFKMKGEETALKIRVMMKKTKIKIRDIFKLLLEWLRFIPGVNKFFLEQEAKIKAEKILALRHLDDLSKL